MTSFLRCVLCKTFAVLAIYTFSGVWFVVAAEENKNEKNSSPSVHHIEVNRTTRAHHEALIGTYLTLSKECIVGASPKMEIEIAPANGNVVTRDTSINLRQVPGAQRTNCVGISPKGFGVYYHPKRKFRGEDQLSLKLIYPNGDIRLVSAKLTVK